MAADKMTLLFGKNAPADLDLDDPDQLRTCLKKTSRVPLEDAELLLRSIIARQILTNDPPLVWETAQRLNSPPVARHKIMDHLSRALAPALGAAVDGDEEEFEERYSRNLRALPVAEFDVEAAVRALLASDVPVNFDDLPDRVSSALGVAELSEALGDLIDGVVDEMLESDAIALLAGDLVVDPEYVCRAIVLTTRVADGSDPYPLETDLAGLCAFVDDADDLDEPPDGLAVGQLMACRVEGEVITVKHLAVPPLDEALLDGIRHAYAVETAESGLPLDFLDLTLRLLVDRPESFTSPQLPLTELVVSAGLEIRGGLIADGPAAWRRLAHGKATFRIIEAASGEQEQRDLLDVYAVFAGVDEDPGEVTTAELRHVLDLMADERVLEIAANQFFGYDDDPDFLELTGVFARRLSAAASKPLQKSVAGVITAMVAERHCDPLAAADALAEAVRHAPDFFPAVDRLAWTRSDQGRISEAKALWSQLVSPDSPDLAALESATGGQRDPGAGMRRNEPCWCGSGRKYKVCHLRANVLPPLPDRFTWLVRKTVAYVERRGAPLERVVAETAWKRAGGDQEKFDLAFEDAVVMDVVLHDYGWFDRFLAERGPLLPEDEQLLYASWQLIPRTVYEIVDVRPGASLRLRDVRSGDLTVVQERVGSQNVSLGQLICARAVPDGRDHRMVGAVLPVPPGREDAFLGIVDDPDPRSRGDRLLSYLAMSSRPPEMLTTTGEPLLFCRGEWSIADPEEAREELDRRYVATGQDRWHQEQPGDQGGLVLATLTLDGSTLAVETMSEYRFDAVMADVMELLPGARLVSEVVEPFDLEAARGSQLPAVHEPLVADTKAALEAWLSQQEEQWCAEPVPALGGLTPHEAAEDPTHRERVIRLIDSFPSGGGVTDDGFATMRPGRLRELLGL